MHLLQVLSQERMMNKKGLTISLIIETESANYGDGVGNTSTLKKMTRGDDTKYTYISRQALRYSIVRALEWDNTPVDAKGPCALPTELTYNLFKLLLKYKGFKAKSQVFYKKKNF